MIRMIAEHKGCEINMALALASIYNKIASCSSKFVGKAEGTCVFENISN